MQICAPPDYPCGSPINGSFLANLDTGAVRRDPAMAAGRVIADLDSRSGAQRLCAPLRVPRGSDPTGSVTFYGKFAVASGFRPDGLPFAILEHCASKLQIRLPLYARQNGKIISAWYWRASSRAVIWQTDPSPVHGILLPELRRFTINLTAAQVRAHAYVTAVTRPTIYIIGRGPSGTGSPLWEAPLPRRRSQGSAASPDFPRNSATAPAPRAASGDRGRRSRSTCRANDVRARSSPLRWAPAGAWRVTDAATRSPRPSIAGAVTRTISMPSRNPTSVVAQQRTDQTRNRILTPLTKRIIAPPALLFEPSRHQAALGRMTA